MHPLTQKPKLGHSGLAESLNHHQRLKRSRMYPYFTVTIKETILGDSLPRDTQEVYYPSLVLSITTDYVAAWDSHSQTQSLSQPRPVLDDQGHPWPVPGEEAAPHLLPAPPRFTCKGRAFTCSLTYLSVSHLRISTCLPQ